MRNAVRFSLFLLLGVVFLAASPAALGDESTYRLVTLSSTTDCQGFAVETIDGTVTGCVPSSGGGVEYSAAADGSIVYMASDNTDPSAGDQGSIWLVGPNRAPAHLDASPWDFAPTISYDGSKVVFARFDKATWSSDIYSVNSDGSDLHLVVSGEGTNYLTVPAISPDGSTVAYWCGPAKYATHTGQGCGPLTDGTYRTSGLMRLNIDGSNNRMIVIGGGDALEPAGPSRLSWSPAARWLALDGLLSVDLGNAVTAQRQLFVYHTDGSDLFDNADPTRQVTHETDPWGPTFGQFSPDGSQLLYLDQGGSYLIGVDGTNRHQVPVDGAFIPSGAAGTPLPLVDMTHITVPSVHALGLKAARTDLAAHNLTVGTVKYRYSAKVHKNRVLSQYPRAGAVAHRTNRIGPPVNLTLSRGRRHHEAARR